jgi:hypothetical protein
MLRLLSRILFFFSSFSILPPRRELQDRIIKKAEVLNARQDDFLKESLSQYYCQAQFFLKFIWFSFNVFSIFMFIPLLIFLFFRSFIRVHTKDLTDISLFPRIPEVLISKYSVVYIKKPFGYIKGQDWKYVFKIIFKSGFRPYFLLRSVWKIAIYSQIVDTFKPERIWVTQEMVFESSILTKYLNARSVEHNNFMHGDNYFSIQVAFCRFNRFYVWDEFYADLFKSLMCKADEYFVFSAINRTTSSCEQKNIFKYYNQESISIPIFNARLDKLEDFAKSHGCELVVRLHPSHREDFEIEVLTQRNIKVEPAVVDIIDSIFEAKYVCSEFSSVLYQASLLNRDIVIDNSSKERFEILKDLDVIFLKKLKHEYLIS